MNAISKDFALSIDKLAKNSRYSDFQIDYIRNYENHCFALVGPSLQEICAALFSYPVSVGKIHNEISLWLKTSQVLELDGETILFNRNYQWNYSV